MHKKPICRSVYLIICGASLIQLAACSDKKIDPTAAFLLGFVDRAHSLSLLSDRDFNEKTYILDDLKPYDIDMIAPKHNIEGHRQNKISGRDIFHYAYWLTPKGKDRLVSNILISRLTESRKGELSTINGLQVQVENNNCYSKGLKIDDIVRYFGKKPDIVKLGKAPPPDYMPILEGSPGIHLSSCYKFSNAYPYSMASVLYKKVDTKNYLVITFSMNKYGVVHTISIDNQSHER